MKKTWTLIALCLAPAAIAEETLQLWWDQMAASASYSVYESVTNSGYALLGTTTNTFYNLGVRTNSSYRWKVVGASQVLELSLGPAPTTPGTTTTNLLLNSSFESSTNSWTLAGNVSLMSKSPWLASSGNSSLVYHSANTTATGTASQSITTTNGATYTLSFDLGAASFSNQFTQGVLVTVIGLTTLASQTFTITAPAFGTKYESKTLTFIGDGSTVAITFSDATSVTQNNTLLLDNVQLVAAQ